MNQREPEPQLGQPYYWAKPSKLCILGNGLRWLLLAALGFQRGVYYKREEKGSLLMHVFLSYLLSFLFTSLFLFTLLFLFQFSLFLALVVLPSIYGYCSYLYWAHPMEFLSFTLTAH